MTELTLAPCPACRGEGYDLQESGDAYALFGSDLPTEEVIPCSHCDGWGEVEVCARCLEAPKIRDGREVCACAVEELRRAA